MIQFHDIWSKIMAVSLFHVFHLVSRNNLKMIKVSVRNYNHGYYLKANVNTNMIINEKMRMQAII